MPSSSILIEAMGKGNLLFVCVAKAKRESIDIFLLFSLFLPLPLINEVLQRPHVKTPFLSSAPAHASRCASISSVPSPSRVPAACCREHQLVQGSIQRACALSSPILLAFSPTGLFPVSSSFLDEFWRLVRRRRRQRQRPDRHQ